MMMASPWARAYLADGDLVRARARLTSQLGLSALHGRGTKPAGVAVIPLVVPNTIPIIIGRVKFTRIVAALYMAGLAARGPSRQHSLS
jgi:hypothetical protein